jgi:CelD/BcsL family acetyltransferase involved in cellulose biosynthesis
LEREHGRVELKDYQQLGSLEEAMSILFKLHQKRWNMKGKAGVFCKEEARYIVMETAKLFEEKNWLRLNFLAVDGKPVAANYDLEYGGIIYGHLCGFDPDYSKYSVGNLLLWKVLQMCIEKGVSEYDFMQGDEHYKYDWTDKHRQNKTVIFVNTTLHSMTVSLILDVITTLKFRFNRMLSSNNLVNAVSSVLQKSARSITVN